MNRLKQMYQSIRSRRWSSLVFDAVIVLILYSSVSSWQGRNLLPTDNQLAPAFVLTGLDGQEYSLAQASGKPVLLYFFAPWCSVCNLSAHNLRALDKVRTDDELTIYLISIGHSSRESVESFARRHELDMPILLGDYSVAANYQVRATPTLYLLDSSGRIKHHSVGYSTELGLRLRTARL